jgi:hypothetical protein
MGVDMIKKTHTLMQVSPRESSENPSKPSTAVQPEAQAISVSRRDAGEVSQHVTSFVRAPSAKPSHPSQAVPPPMRQAPPPECGDPLMARALAMLSNQRQATPATPDTDPETGFPIIDGAICPF